MTALADLATLRATLAAQWKAADAELVAIAAELQPTPPPPPPTGLIQLSGIYPGYANLAGFTAFEAWLGKPLHFVVQFGDARSASFFESSVWGELSPASPTAGILTLAKRCTLVLSVPLCFGAQNPSQATAGAGLAGTVAGANDGTFQRVAGYVKAAGFAAVVIRFWEGDGVPGWMPWSSVGNEPVFVKAAAHVATIFRAGVPGCRIDYCGTLGFAAEYQKAYPGDAVVDICGLDVYDPGSSGVVTDGLAVHDAFAAAHGKPVSLPEWGLTTTDDPGFVNDVLGFAGRLGPRLAYQSYFNENTNGAHTLATFPNSAARYKSLVTA